MAPESQTPAEESFTIILYSDGVPKEGTVLVQRWNLSENGSASAQTVAELIQMRRNEQAIFIKGDQAQLTNHTKIRIRKMIGSSDTFEFVEICSDN